MEPLSNAELKMKKAFLIFILLIFLQIGTVRGQLGGPINLYSNKPYSALTYGKDLTIISFLINVPFQIKHTIRLINKTKSNNIMVSFFSGGISVSLGTFILFQKDEFGRKYGAINIGIGLTTITLALLEKYRKEKPHYKKIGWNIYILPPIHNQLGLGFVRKF